MIVNRSIVYRIYPTNKQKQLIEKTFDCCRKIWNCMLYDWTESYKRDGKTTTTTPKQYKDKYTELKEVDSLALCNEQELLFKSYGNFIKGETHKPKYKSKNRNSYTTSFVYNNIRIGGNGIRLPKLKNVEARIHCLPEDGWIIKTATISRKGFTNKYYVSVMFECDISNTLQYIDVNKAIGLDYKSDGLYMDSNGDIGSVHKFFRESQKKIAEAQQKLSRMVEGSTHFKQQQQLISKLYKRTADQRKDYLQKLSTQIADNYDIVCIEDINMLEMAQKKHMSKATFDNGYGMFIRMLEYKLIERGKLLIRVDMDYTTQTCSNCGHIHKLDIKDRTYICPNCGLEIDRDLNAAKNILKRGLQMLAEKFNEAA